MVLSSGLLQELYSQVLRQKLGHQGHLCVDGGTSAVDEGLALWAQVLVAVFKASNSCRFAPWGSTRCSIRSASTSPEGNKNTQQN